MWEGAADAVALFVRFDILIVLVAGTVIGFTVALLPGIGGSVTMAMLLPVTFTMEPLSALMFLVAIMSAGGFAGAVTQILMRVPGDSNVASMLDGYPLARRGQGSEAIGAAVGASTLGAMWGLFFLVLSLPVLRQLALLFGPPELFVIALAGVILIAVMSTGGGPTKAIIAGAFGMLAGTVGYNLITGEVRFTFGYPPLYDGVPLVPVVAGLFAVPELFSLIKKNQSVSLNESLSKGGVWRGIRIAWKHPGLVIRSSVIGAGIGAIPGVGSSVSTWIAYYAAQATSKSPETFGKGNFEGIIAPEASRDAREGGSMIPLLALGVPGGIATAILLSGFLIHGVDTGPRLFESNMVLVWALILTILWTNIVVGAVGAISANQVAKITLLPVRLLAPFILTMLLIGSYVVTRSYFGMWVGIIAGVVGLAMTRLGYSRPPLLLGLILLPIMERNFYSSLQIYQSFSWLMSPTVLVIIVVTAVTALGPRLLRAVRRADDARSPMEEAIPVAVATADSPPPAVSDHLSEAAPPHGPDPEDPGTQNIADMLNDDPELAGIWHLIASTTLLVIVALMIWRSFDYSSDARQFPLGLLATLVVILAIDLTRLLSRARKHGGLKEHLFQTTDGLQTRDSSASSVMAAVWLAALPMMMLWLGMLSGIFIYTVVFIAFFESLRPSRRRILGGFIGATAAVLVVHYVFTVLVGVRLPSGAVGIPFLPG